MPPDSLRGVTGAGGGEEGGEGVLSTDTSLQLAERPGLTSVTLLMLSLVNQLFWWTMIRQVSLTVWADIEEREKTKTNITQ